MHREKSLPEHVVLGLCVLSTQDGSPLDVLALWKAITEYVARGGDMTSFPADGTFNRDRFGAWYLDALHANVRKEYLEVRDDDFHVTDVGRTMAAGHPLPADLAGLTERVRPSAPDPKPVAS